MHLTTMLEGTFGKAVLTAMVIALGLFAAVFSPLLSVLLLIGVVLLMPIDRVARVSLAIIGCISIGLGAALATGDLPISQIASLKLYGSPVQAAVSCLN